MEIVVCCHCHKRNRGLYCFVTFDEAVCSAKCYKEYIYDRQR